MKLIAKIKKQYIILLNEKYKIKINDNNILKDNHLIILGGLYDRKKRIFRKLIKMER